MLHQVPTWTGRRSRVQPPSGSRSAETWEQDPGYLSYHERDRPWKIVDANLDGVVDESYYDPRQMEYGLPANLPASTYLASRQFAAHNERVHTSIIQPGTGTTGSLLTRNQTIQPINAELGISSTPQFQPLVAQYTDAGSEVLTRLDPLTADSQVDELVSRDGSSDPSKYGPEGGNRIRLSDVYDPRHTGYGDPYREYEDVVTGQIRYYYGDVDAYKIPNYIVRSEIDHMDFADSYGPLKEEYAGAHAPGEQAPGSLGDIGSCGRPWAESGDIRGKVEERYLADDIAFRTSMMESLMRKRNQEAWQRRVAPLSQSAHTRGFKSGPM